VHQDGQCLVLVARVPSHTGDAGVTDGWAYRWLLTLAPPPDWNGRRAIGERRSAAQRWCRGPSALTHPRLRTSGHRAIGSGRGTGAGRRVVRAAQAALRRQYADTRNPLPPRPPRTRARGGQGAKRNSRGERGTSTPSPCARARGHAGSTGAELVLLHADGRVPPHAFQIDCGFSRARAHSDARRHPRTVAAAGGFRDQAHLTRTSRRVGVLRAATTAQGGTAKRKIVQEPPTAPNNTFAGGW